MQLKDEGNGNNNTGSRWTAQTRREQRKTHQTTNDYMDKKLTLNELHAALRQLKAKKSPDAITNEMLAQLGNKATCKLLEIFNHS